MGLEKLIMVDCLIVFSSGNSWPSTLSYCTVMDVDRPMIRLRQKYRMTTDPEDAPLRDLWVNLDQIATIEAHES